MERVVTIRLDDGPNMEGRKWAARLLAHIGGFPFRFRVLSPDEAILPADGPSLYYGRRRGLDGLTIEASGWFDGDVRDGGRIPAAPSGKLDDAPVLFGGGEIERRATGVRIKADVLASAFILANRLVERASPARDEHGRFPAAASIPGANGFLDLPVVDLYARAVARELARMHPALAMLRPWPGGRPAICVTHDIETLAPLKRLAYLRDKSARAARELFFRRDAAASWRHASAGVRRAITGESPLWTFDRLREVERPWPGTYYVFGGATSPLDGEYDPQSPRVRAALAELMEEGCEVGVHFGYGTGADADLMRRQKEKVEAAIGRRVAGGRHHYLRAEFPAAWRAHEEAGLRYDSSLGFAEEPGFRAGTSYPLRPFDVDAGRQLDIYEAPLVAMDGTFLQYKGLTGEETVERVRALAETTAAAGGVFTLLWHNTNVDPYDSPGPARAYREIVGHLKEMGGWGATVEGCVEAWKAHCERLEVK